MVLSAGVISQCYLVVGLCSSLCFFFFFQAEDGIRDLYVTGVQTCALPISLAIADDAPCRRRRFRARADAGRLRRPRGRQIGRASCRGRVEILVVAGSL